jgi:hypothetical protein
MTSSLVFTFLGVCAVGLIVVAAWTIACFVVQSWAKPTIPRPADASRCRRCERRARAQDSTVCARCLEDLCVPVGVGARIWR